MIEDAADDNSRWSNLTDPVLLYIFGYLSANDVVSAGTTCKNWNRLHYDEFLWKRLFYNDFNIDSSIGIKPGKSSWLDEYKRLMYHVPSVETEVLKSHSAPVVHVSFSHNGAYFVTCSMDGFVHVWNASFPATVAFSYDMKPFNWKFPFHSEFNESDTLLLVAGGHFGWVDDTSGQIAVFAIDDEMTLTCRILNKPYDTLGTFYSNEYILSGMVEQLTNVICSSNVWLHKAYPDCTSEHKPLMSRLYRFINVYARTLLVAKCKASDDANSSCYDPSTSKSSKIKCFSDTEALDRNFRKRVIAMNRKYANKPRFMYNDGYKIVEYDAENVSDSESGRIDCTNRCELCCECDDEDDDVDSDEELAYQPEKYLIFTTRSKTTAPHQIGFKKIGRVTFPKKLDPGPSLTERIAEQKERAHRPPIVLEDINIDDLSKNYDSLDHLIELHGHIVGMKLSPDHRYLYVNCRPWPEGYVISHPLDPPPVAQEIDIHVIDLNTFKEVGGMLRAHRAYTPSDECFMIFLDVCNEYIASGSEDKHAYLWDRHYGIALTKFPHKNVVNGVAFNPKDPETLVTVSDDNSIRVWRSRARCTELGFSEIDYPRSIRL